MGTKKQAKQPVFCTGGQTRSTRCRTPPWRPTYAGSAVQRPLSHDKYAVVRLETKTGSNRSPHELPRYRLIFLQSLRYHLLAMRAQGKWTVVCCVAMYLDTLYVCHTKFKGVNLKEENLWSKLSCICIILSDY